MKKREKRKLCSDGAAVRMKSGWRNATQMLNYIGSLSRMSLTALVAHDWTTNAEVWQAMVRVCPVIVARGSRFRCHGYAVHIRVQSVDNEVATQMCKLPITRRSDDTATANATGITISQVTLQASCLSQPATQDSARACQGSTRQLVTGTGWFVQPSLSRRCLPP
jgi:hypothetical protein